MYRIHIKRFLKSSQFKYVLIIFLVYVVLFLKNSYAFDVYFSDGSSVTYSISDFYLHNPVDESWSYFRIPLSEQQIFLDQFMVQPIPLNNDFGYQCSNTGQWKLFSTYPDNIGLCDTFRIDAYANGSFTDIDIKINFIKMFDHPFSSSSNINSNTISSIACTGTITLDVSGSPVCSSGWTTIQTVEPFNIDRLSMETLGYSFGAGFSIFGILYVTSWGFSILLLNVKRG